MFLTFAVACLDTAYGLRDIYKYDIFGEKVCARIDEISAKPTVSMRGQGRTTFWHSSAMYRYTYRGKAYVGTKVWPDSYEFAKAGDTSVVAATNDRIRALAECALVTINSKNPQDAVIFVPENSDMLWVLVKRKFFIFVFLVFVYYLLSLPRFE